MPTYSFKVHSCKKVVCAAQKYKAERESVLMLKLTNTWIERNNSFYRWIKLANFLVAYLLLSQKYTHREMVFCYQNCSDLLWSRKTFEIRGWRPRICKIFEITRTIHSNSERSEQFLVTECFFNLFLEVSHIYFFLEMQ